MEERELLVVIPARGGSRGIPGKNIKPLAGKPLLEYAIDNARSIADDKDICVTTDDRRILEVAERYGLSVPFIRPDHLASDTAGSYEVLLHAVEFYKMAGVRYRHLLLLQPTSPFRRDVQIRAAWKEYRATGPELLVSVKSAKGNPYYNLFEEDADGYLVKSKESDVTRRQDLPPVYEYNGAIYFTNVEDLSKKPFSAMKRIRKFEMDEISSHDLDTPLDWGVAEWLIANAGALDQVATQS